MEIHGDKLAALLRNPKLPKADHQKVEEAIDMYRKWTNALDSLTSKGEALLQEMVDNLNEYKRFIEFDLIFCSKNDFLYRQKGQLKLDNTVLEEFLPRLVDDRLIPGIFGHSDLIKGPQKSFAGLTFGYFHNPLNDGGISIKEKDQDFSVGRKIYLKASTNPIYSAEDTFEQTVSIGYLVAEIKTNLDKTMFQEAAATSRELKKNVNGATYLLLAEWLDMPPIDTRQTDIDEVILLRKAKRLNSNVRASFSESSDRLKKRDFYFDFLNTHPYEISSFQRIVDKLNITFPKTITLDENEILKKGYF